MKKNKMILLSIIGIIVLCTSGCFGSVENYLSSGQMLEAKGDYVVINYGGNQIFDIWTLENAYVQNSENSDGYYFTDDNGNFITVSGDVLVIRCNKKEEFNKYQEYHKRSVE